MKGMILFCVICAAIVLKKTNFNNVFRASILCINDNNAWNTFVQYLFSIWSHNKLLRRVLYHRVNVEQSYHFLFVSLLDLSFWSYQVERIIRVQILLDSPSTFLLLKTKRTECCVSGTPITRQPQYLILSTLPVHTTGDTLFTTIIELTNRFLMGILRMLTMTSVKWKYMVKHALKCFNSQKQRREHISFKSVSSLNNWSKLHNLNRYITVKNVPNKSLLHWTIHII